MMPDNGAPSAGPGPTSAPNGGEQLTTGSTSASTTAAGRAGPTGPIGATTQTMPAKFSQRNDVLDRVPTTAWPLPLNEEQRRQIFNSVMADSSPPAAGARQRSNLAVRCHSNRRSICIRCPELWQIWTDCTGCNT